MKHAKRNLVIALGLATSLVLPGLAMADNWNKQSMKYQAQQRHVQQRGGHEHDRYRESARRDGNDHHEWREHDRGHGGYERDTAYSHNEWREHAYRYHGPRHYYGYGVYPGAYVPGAYIAPSLGIFIDLR